MAALRASKSLFASHGRALRAGPKQPRAMWEHGAAKGDGRWGTFCGTAGDCYPYDVIGGEGGSRRRLIGKANLAVLQASVHANVQAAFGCHLAEGFARTGDRQLGWVIAILFVWWLFMHSS